MAEKTCVRCKQPRTIDQFFYRGIFQKRLCRICLEADECRTETLVCRKCYQELPVAAFNLNKGQRVRYCKKCQKEHGKQSRENRRNQQIAEDTIRKKCSRCGTVKSSIEFYRSKNTSDGLLSYCKQCMSEAARDSGETALVKIGGLSLTKQKILAWMRNFAVDYDSLLGVLTRAAGCCEICGVPFHRTQEMCVDHNHKNQKVRGILCHNCNFLLGHAKDNQVILQSAATYLKDRNQ